MKNQYEAEISTKVLDLAERDNKIKNLEGVYEKEHNDLEAALSTIQQRDSNIQQLQETNEQAIATLTQKRTK